MHTKAYDKVFLDAAAIDLYKQIPLAEFIHIL